jgi:hypothetical protein
LFHSAWSRVLQLLVTTVDAAAHAFRSMGCRRSLTSFYANQVADKS